MSLKVVVVGATGNVGLSLMEELRARHDVHQLVGVARRPPGASVRRESALARVLWITADIARDPLDFVEGADVVVHLAWQIQPSRHESMMRRTNVDGTRRLFDAVVAHRVPKLVYASSVGTYAAGPKHETVDESWPTTGIPSSIYSRHKAEVERMLDELQFRRPELSVVRMRTSLVFQRRAASEVHRLFLGRLAPWHLPRPLRWIPRIDRLVFQATATADVADAYARAVVMDVEGAFNIAADPPLTASTIAEVCDGRTVAVPASVLRGALAASYRARLHPLEPGWFDMAVGTPLLDSTRAMDEMGWKALRAPSEALADLLAGMSDGAGADTLPLEPRPSPVH